MKRPPATGRFDGRTRWNREVIAVRTFRSIIPPRSHDGQMVWRVSGKTPAEPAKRGFTLLELLIVVAIISILAVIAIPNLLEAQTRSKVARVKAEMRTLATAMETFCTDYGHYPEAACTPKGYPPSIYTALQNWSAGLCTFRTGGREECDEGDVAIGGIDFPTLTTPAAYISGLPTDPFAAQLGGNIYYAYKSTNYHEGPTIGWIITSVGPDTDIRAPEGRGNTDTTNPISTAAQTHLRDDPCPCGCGGMARILYAAVPMASLADINEDEVIRFLMNDPLEGKPKDVPFLYDFLDRLTYDPTNGTISDGDLWRMRE